MFFLQLLVFASPRGPGGTTNQSQAGSPPKRGPPRGNLVSPRIEARLRQRSRRGTATVALRFAAFAKAVLLINFSKFRMTHFLVPYLSKFQGRVKGAF
ncbi:hypothetical protein D770_26680 [Flammeovirgaceae bacterium 311]|nr:hypothetical protein D770_26680 [Flammeovirgaceae bacterium 311]